MMQTPDLSKEFNPVPKPLAKVKMPKAMKKEGKKTKSWTEERNGLKVKFAQAGVTKCELRYKQCWINNTLGFAHAKKRRKLTESDLGLVILACVPCHDEIEYLSAEEMEKIVMTIIANRKVRL